jgi:hypothetical protein
MTRNAAEILQEYLNPQDFYDHDGWPPLSPHLLYGIFTSYTENYIAEATKGKPYIPEGAPRSGVTPLEAIAAARVLIEQFSGSRWWIASEARKQGHSWTEIGDALGMTKQAAWEGLRKYADRPHEPWLDRLHGEYRTLAGDSADA